MNLQTTIANKSQNTSLETFNVEVSRQMALLIGNKAVLSKVFSVTNDLSLQPFKASTLDQAIVQRIITLIKQKSLVRKKIRSADIYSRLCSKQNWYYRILGSSVRIAWILKEAFLLLKSEPTLCLSFLTDYKPKPLFTKTKRANYSEGIRRIRYLEICVFLKFTTKHLNSRKS